MSQLDFEMRNILLDPTCAAKPLLISEGRWRLLCSACEAGIGDDTDGGGGGMGSGGVGYVVIEKKQCDNAAAERWRHVSQCVGLSAR